MEEFKEIVGGILLAIAAQPIHEGGHALAAWILTGVWPRIGFWAVYPVNPLQSKRAALLVLAAGDIAVLVWWTLLFVLVRGQPGRKWALVGPSFMLAIVLLNWIASAALFPFGYANVGASDAAKFLMISGVRPWNMAASLIGVAGGIAVAAARYFRSPEYPKHGERYP